MLFFPLESLRPLSLSDRAVLEPLILSLEPHSCELNFLNLYTWSRISNTKFVVFAGLPWIWFPPRSTELMPRIACRRGNKALAGAGEQSEDLLLFPGGLKRELWPSPPQLQAVMRGFRQAGYAGGIGNVPAEYRQFFPALESFFKIAEENSAVGEYLYSIDQLLSLQGRKLAKKKNLISQFCHLYPSHSLRDFTADCIPACRQLAQRWYASRPADNYSRAEAEALEQTFAAVGELAFEGLCLYVETELVGFSLVSRLNSNTCDEHFEKVDLEYKGASQMLFHSLLQRLSGRYELINREQDLGLAGLRQVKRSYNPLEFRRQYQFCLRDDFPD